MPATLALALAAFPPLAFGQEVNEDLQHPTLGRVTQISYGWGHTMLLRGDGALFGEGKNDKGQIGDGTTEHRLQPSLTFTGVSQVAAGYEHTLFLLADGRAWSTGRNDLCQLGDGTRRNRNFPRLVLRNVVRVAAGYSHSLFLKADGTVWAAGMNQHGQIGDGTVITRCKPVEVPGVESISAIAAGSHHSIFVESNGQAWGVGLNSYGQVGDGSRLSHKTATLGPAGISDVYALMDYTVYFHPNGSTFSVGMYEGGTLSPRYTLNGQREIAESREYGNFYSVR